MQHALVLVRGPRTWLLVGCARTVVCVAAARVSLRGRLGYGSEGLSSRRGGPRRRSERWHAVEGVVGYTAPSEQLEQHGRHATATIALAAII